MVADLANRPGEHPLQESRASCVAWYLEHPDLPIQASPSRGYVYVKDRLGLLSDQPVVRSVLAVGAQGRRPTQSRHTTQAARVV